jgi:SAM-dependent methyltransferase
VRLWDVDDYLRLRTGGDDDAFEAFARRRVSPDARVLEIGCGPGRAAAALAARHGARVTAVDVAPEMLAAARSHVPASVTVVEARAEELPFEDGSFDVALAQYVVHLLDRPRAFAEIRRVLRTGGLFWLKTTDPDCLEDYWLTPLFPSYLAVERPRFPSRPQLERELGAAGFGRVSIEEIHLVRDRPKDRALDMLRSRAFSTLQLLPPEELAAGAEAAERTLPDPVPDAVTMLSAEGWV